MELKKHNNHQSSCCNLYHAWRHESKINMRKVLSIIHDGLDANKTTILCLQATTKATARLYQLHVSLHQHGHGDDAYAHHTIDLWPKDSNFTISSLLRCLRTWGKPPMANFRKLFDELPLNDYFEKLPWANPCEHLLFLFFEINFLSPLNIVARFLL